MSKKEIVYSGYDNKIVRRLLRDGEELTEEEKAAITKVKVALSCGPVYDSAEDDEVEYDAEDGLVRMWLGRDEELYPGRHTAFITVFDPKHENGVAWSQFMIDVQNWLP